MFEEYVGNKLQTPESLRKLNENLLFEMASILPRKSGLPYKIWLDPLGENRKNQHSHTPRIKVEVDGKYIPVTISDTPEIPKSALKNGAKIFPGFSDIKEYIVAYKKVLIAHFYRMIDDEDALKLLHKVEEAPRAINYIDDVLENTPTKEKIVFYWDSKEKLYVIQVIDSEEELFETHYALNKSELSSLIHRLKNELDISKVIDKDKKK